MVCAAVERDCCASTGTRGPPYAIRLDIARGLLNEAPFEQILGRAGSDEDQIQVLDLLVDRAQVRSTGYSAKRRHVGRRWLWAL